MPNKLDREARTMKPISDERAKELRNWCDEVDALFDPHANTSPCAEVFVPTSDVRALLATRKALAKLVRRCRESPQLEPLLHDRVACSDGLCHASCPLCSAEALITERPDR